MESLSLELERLRRGLEELSKKTRGAARQALCELLQGKTPQSPVTPRKASQTSSDAAAKVRAKVARSWVYQQKLTEMNFEEKTIGVLARIVSNWQGAARDLHRSVLVVAGCSYERTRTAGAIAALTGYTCPEVCKCLSILREGIGDPHLRMEDDHQGQWRLIDACDVEMHGDYI